jgi:signal recognition particle subunit SRP68
MEMDTENQQQTEQQQAVPQVSNLQLSILATIKTAQLQNGLKHGDYSRYR